MTGDVLRGELIGELVGEDVNKEGYCSALQEVGLLSARVIKHKSSVCSP